MKYIIDDANLNHIKDVLALGIDGVTANPAMYYKNNIQLIDFIKQCKDFNLSFLSGEVINDGFEEMKEEAQQLLEVTPDIVIKINFSKEGLRLCHDLHKRGVKTAITLIFNLSQVAAAIQANADYIFFFIGRNDEIGVDGLTLIRQASQMCKNTSTKIVAASIKNAHHLNELFKMDIDYAAIPYSLYISSLDHPLSISGKASFQSDWNKLLGEKE